MNKGNAINNAKVKNNSIEWYLPHYTPSLEQQTISSNQIGKKIPTELQYIERSVFMKEVNTQNLWTFEMGTQEGINVPIWIVVGFQQQDRQASQNLDNDTYFRPPVTSAQSNFETKRFPDSVTSVNYDDDDYSQGYAQTNEPLRAQTKDDVLQPDISEHDFRSSNDDNNFG